MAAYTHVTATLLGRFITGNYWNGEIAQTGVRIAVWPGPTAPDLDAPLPIREVDIAYEEVDTTNYIGVIGFTGQGEYWSHPTQVETADALRQWAVAVAGQQYNGFEWTGIKLSPISPTGDLAASSTLINFKATVKGSATEALPPQVAIACSMRSNVPGRRGRGRMYLPAVSKNTAAVTGTIGSTARNALGNATRSLLNNVESLGGLGVTTRVVVTSAGNPRYVLPSQVRIGDQYDTQRRRRNQVRETYSTF